MADVLFGSRQASFAGDHGLRKAPEPRALIKRMREYHPPLGSRDGLRLDFNENTLACSPRVLDALGKIAAADLTRYPERESVERKAAAALGVQPEQALLTNGVDEAIHVLCQTFLTAATSCCCRRRPTPCMRYTHRQRRLRSRR